MRVTNIEKLKTQLNPGKVYRRSDLEQFTSAIDRDLKKLTSQDILQKVGAGLYFYPKITPYGCLPPNDDVLIKSFLKVTTYLKINWNDYNKLGLGLTQLYNKVVVYNHKRHEEKKLAGFLYDFRRPPNGFPNVISKEFLLVDLFNNIDELGEDLNLLKKRLKKNLHQYNMNILKEIVLNYSKIKTKHAFMDLI